MSQLNKISIPQPCHQSWQQMTPVNNGRHCQQCCKTVTDFTKMTNDEVIGYLTTNHHVCGRFGQQQLNNINYQILPESLPVSKRYKIWAMAIGLAGSITFYKANAQTKPVTVQIAAQPQNVCENRIIGKVLSPNLLNTKEIKGCVTDDQNIVIPGALIRIKGSNLGAITNIHGDFNLRVPISTTQFIVSNIGYSSQIININADANYTVKLQEPVFLGDVVVIKQKQPFFKRIYYRYIRRPIRKIFN